MKQFNKFLILGAFSTLIDFLIYFVFIKLEFHYVVAIIFGYLSGFIFNFFVGRKIIFTNGRKLKNFAQEFNAVLSINILAILLNIFIVYILVDSAHILDELSARAVAIGVVFFWNYFARKWFVYH